jgi:hypothetical protein
MKAFTGHKTMSDGRHIPLSSEECAELWEKIEQAREKRERDMPDEHAALLVMGSAIQRLRDLGWADAVYCPKDGSCFDAIEAGSTGVHRCHYLGEWPTGSWWISDEGDLWPARPILWRARSEP